MAKSVSSSVAVSGSAMPPGDRGLHGRGQLEGRVVVGDPDEEGGRFEDLAPQRFELRVTDEGARGQQGQAQVVWVPHRGLVGLDRAGQAEGRLAQHGHGHEVARQGLAAGVVTAGREERVVRDRAQDGRFDRLLVLVDEGLLGLGALAQLADLEAQLGGGHRDQVDDAGGVILERRADERLALGDGVRAHAGQELTQGRRELLRLEVAQRLVEDLVPGVIGSVGGHEDRGAHVVLLVVGLVEEAELLGHDDEALLGELGARLRGRGGRRPVRSSPPRRARSGSLGRRTASRPRAAGPARRRRSRCSRRAAPTRPAPGCWRTPGRPQGRGRADLRGPPWRGSRSAPFCDGRFRPAIAIDIDAGGGAWSR